MIKNLLISDNSLSVVNIPNKQYKNSNFKTKKCKKSINYNKPKHDLENNDKKFFYIINNTQNEKPSHI